MIRERDIGQEATGLILQVAQHGQVLDAVIDRFDVTVQHRAVLADAELVGLAMHVDVVGAGELLVGDRVADGGPERLRAATGKRASPASRSAISTSSRLIFSIRAM